MATIDRLRELVRGTRPRPAPPGAPSPGRTRRDGQAPPASAVAPGVVTVTPDDASSDALARALDGTVPPVAQSMERNASAVSPASDASTSARSHAIDRRDDEVDTASLGAASADPASADAADAGGADARVSGERGSDAVGSPAFGGAAFGAPFGSDALDEEDDAREAIAPTIGSTAGSGLRELTYEPVGADGLPIPAPRAMPALTGASPIHTPLGSCIVIDHLFPADRPHGRHLVRQGIASLREVLDFCGQPVLAPADDGRRGLLFLDLETTGLSGGAGTLAFLVGCGFFDQDGFRTRQFLLPSFGAERALMHAVTSLVGEADCLVTYNGRTFDLPLMETRWLFHRVPPPWTELPHLDMLPLARRLWRERDEVARNGCRLVTLEQVLFGVVREGDVPGWEIPGRYFEYVRGGNAALLEPVLHHNRLDLLSLALLTARAMRLFREGAAGTYDPQECLAVGRELWRRRETERAVACFKTTADGATTSGAVKGEALYSWARLLRRERRFVEAADAWARLAACRGARPALLAEAREALAIHYEHRDRNLDKAHEWAAGAFDVESPGSRREAVAHRLARLRRKIRVQAECGPMTALLLDELL